MRGDAFPQGGLKAMGSIEIFPRTQPRRAAIDAWRATPLPGSGAIRVREARFEDYAAVRALQKRAGPAEPCTLRQYESRLHGFAAGQMVALHDGHVVGYASALILDWDAHAGPTSWRTLTGEGHFTTHDPAGCSLYGAQVAVEGPHGAFGAGRALVHARRKLCRRLNLRRVVATPALAGYAAACATMSPEHYAMRIVWGDALEPTWRFLAAQGFQYCGVLHDFLPEDAGSLGHAGLLAWLNPMYAPPRPPADEQSQPRRKCA
jgi:GNAT superfamily N-acetyltransferase